MPDAVSPRSAATPTSRCCSRTSRSRRRVSSQRRPELPNDGRSGDRQGAGEGARRPVPDVPGPGDRRTRRARDRQPAPERRRRWPALLAAWPRSRFSPWSSPCSWAQGPRRRPTRSFTSTRPRTRWSRPSPSGDRASSVAVGDGYVWVTSIAGRSLWRVDPSTGDTTSHAGRWDPARRRRPERSRRRGERTLRGQRRPDRRGVRGSSSRRIPLPGAEGAARRSRTVDEGIWVAACGYGGGNVARVSESRRHPAVARRPSTESASSRRIRTSSSVTHPTFPAYTDVAVGEGSSG